MSKSAYSPAFYISSGSKDIEILVDGNGFPLVSGLKTPFIIIEKNCIITGWELVSGETDSLVCDIFYNSSLSGTPVSITDSGIKPSLIASKSNAGSDLTGWSTSLVSGGVLSVSLSGTLAASTWITLRLKME